MTEKILDVLIVVNLLSSAYSIWRARKCNTLINDVYEAAKFNHEYAQKNVEHSRRLREIERNMIGLRAEQENTSEN